MNVRPAGPADVPALHALVERAYRGAAARAGWTHEADLLDGQRTDAGALAEHVADPDQTILMARDGADLVGCVLVARPGAGPAYIGMVSVDPTRQAAGIGRLLLREAEREAARRGAVRAEMTVIVQRTELIAWYVRRGYRPTGEERPFPMDDPRFGLPRRDDLRFVVLDRAL